MLRVSSKKSMLVKNLISRYSTESSLSAAHEVLLKNENAARIISLNRPSKFNALTTPMVNQIIPTLLEYNKSKVANCVIIESSYQDQQKTPFFCAGGDVAEAAKNVINSAPEKAMEFFHSEYSLNYLLSIYSKPVIAYMNGITMGGGLGLAVHSPFRIATENTRCAMPETEIGFFPDVGMSFFLPRMDGNLGKFLALTGESIYGIDNLIAGFATHYVPSNRLEELTKRLGGINIPNNESLRAINENELKDITAISEQINEYFAIMNSAIEEFTDSIPDSHQFKYSNEQRNLIDKVFLIDSPIEAIFNQLHKIGESTDTPSAAAFATSVLNSLKTKSPISLKIADQLLKVGSQTNNSAAITQELILAQNLLADPKSNDFVEGVSKKLIEKAGNPSWKAEKVFDVSNTDIHKLFTNKHVPFPTLIDFSNNEEFYLNDYKHYPFNMGLPSELEIKQYISGDDGSNRDYAPTKKEVMNKFVNKYSNKAGVEWKVENVLQRKTKAHEVDPEYIALND